MTATERVSHERLAELATRNPAGNAILKGSELASLVAELQSLRRAPVVPDGHPLARYGTALNVWIEGMEQAGTWDAATLKRLREIISPILDEMMAAPAVPDGWRDISTAPQNTKVLVAYQNTLGNWLIVTACYHTQLPWSDDHWRDDDDDSEYAPAGWYEESDSSETIYPTSSRPTHWMPLPAAPTPPEEPKP